MRFVVFGFVLAFMLACSSTGTSASVLSELPLGEVSATPLDGSYRVRVQDAESTRELIVVVRSDHEGFGFEAMDELGLPVLAWPVHEGAPLRAQSNLVARLILLTLAPVSVWTHSLEGSVWTLAVQADRDTRVLTRNATELVRISAVRAGGHDLLFCERGISTSGHECARGDALRVHVEPLTVAAAP